MSDEHWMHRPFHVPGQRSLDELAMPEIDREGSHPGERVVPGFGIGDEVEPVMHPKHGTSGHAGKVIGYYRGNLVVREPQHGTTVHMSPNPEFTRKIN